ncbi:MAG: NAD-dependent DNA ligase LigA [Treponema sp.]|nr:NAD-dependent DNA ligase LigA [Treponema sp.]
MNSFDVDSVQRISELENLIKKYQKSYYNGEGEISDGEFDALWDELKTLDPLNPILHKVGADSGNFEKLPHIMPMGSQEKAANPEQFLSWVQKHTYKEYLVEYKLDGASLELQYENGTLIHAVTRGDGHIGDDITANALKMKGVLKKLYSDPMKEILFTGGIRGEVIMTHQVHKEFFSDKANCRNAANGLMKRKDGAGCEYLTLITYDVWATNGNQPFNDEEGKIEWLKNCGFSTVPLYIANSAQEVIDYRSNVMEIRKSLDYDIDGLVIKERTINHEDASRDRPDRQIAFKFSLEEAVSVLRKVEWNESGATYTPVAIFDPVELNGTTVKRASLVNPRTIRSLGIKIGSHVVVVKRGEIIPKIESVIKNNEINSLHEISYPEVCSECGEKLVDEGTRLYCPNKKCKKRILHQILKWISVIDIHDFGETLVRSLFNDGIILSITDIYKLTEKTLTPYFLTEESISKEQTSKGAKKVFLSIQNHRNVSLAKFIAGFDIEGIGEVLVEKLISSGLRTLDSIIKADESYISNIYGFADTMAHTFVTGMKENISEMQNLIDNGIITIEDNMSGKILEGKSFCFTGELLTMKRSEAQTLVKENGGMVKSSVVKDLSYLVTNDITSGSAKNIKAKQLGIPVITEQEFLAIVQKQM